MAKKKKIELEVPVHCAHDEMVRLEDLHPNLRNPNTHPPEQIELLAKIIKTTGWRSPITVSNQTGLIVRGHGRLEAAKKAGLNYAPVNYQDYASEQEEWADLLADNKIASLAEWNYQGLTEVLTDLDASNFEMELTGWDQGALESLMTWAPNESHETEKLPEPTVTGEDDTAGRLLLVFADEDEKMRWLDLLGFSGVGNKTLFSIADLDKLG